MQAPKSYLVPTGGEVQAMHVHLVAHERGDVFSRLGFPELDRAVFAA